ncbi:hypothetical protein MesoLjLc_22270 [Mesorhizobium sp. L-8-10]|uniref:hypothetical protein n=1 Tax=unclassified Mesorhizobium TaxID=325217 RepID=UPI001928CB91|nr:MULTISPECIES: hypothetical protein [unclassified Mesorhizobium]BCH22485.1 hypothetical protein MesoLjLb_22700 [Mesorhizobium sp. L-8-3]BCH30297.1 hypothetical protein MesoLjLc_22270 [Mesorhizobium sp. L-8-10]
MRDQMSPADAGSALADTTLIAMELHEALGSVGAPARLMSIVASWMLTQDDSATLELLRQFNASLTPKQPGPWIGRA